MWCTHLSSSSSGSGSSQSTLRSHNDEKSSLYWTERGAKRFRGSHRPANLLKTVRFVKLLLSAGLKSPLSNSGSFPRFTLPKKRGLTSACMRSGSVCQIIPTIPTVLPSLETSGGGGREEKVKPFTPISARPNMNWKPSASDLAFSNDR